jgi:hypothetical protein
MESQGFRAAGGRERGTQRPKQRHGLDVVAAEGADEEAGHAVPRRPGGVALDIGRIGGEERKAAAAVYVDVDESGADGEPGGIDDGRSGHFEIATHRDDPAVAAENVGAGEAPGCEDNKRQK